MSSRNTPPRELTWLPLLLGVVLGILFGASSLYLALKVGMTVSASIPSAVLAITLFKVLGATGFVRRSTILENNIVQTTGSAGESIAFGVAATMPALMILGFDMTVGQVLVVAVFGGVLGILMMIPLRQILIVKGSRELTYPEGTACAHVLEASEKGGIGGKLVLYGFLVGFGYKILNLVFKLWNDVPEKILSSFKGAYISAEVSPELLGVGYIIGTRTSSMMVAGGVLSTFVLTPMIIFFGSGSANPLFPANKLISQMSPHEVWKNYVLYIGAGAVAGGGIVSLLHSCPSIWYSVSRGIQSLLSADKQNQVARTEKDLPFGFVLGGVALMVAGLTAYRPLELHLVGALLLIIFAFLFVLVGARLSGEVGSSSCPTSGMTVFTLLATSLIFFALGYVRPVDRIAALSIAGVICVASSVGGSIAQDLKTGSLVGGTPKLQEIAILIGAVTSALVIGVSLQALNQASTIYSTRIPPLVKVPDNLISQTRENLTGPEGRVDHQSYRVLYHTYAPESGPLSRLAPGKYLVADNGIVKYLVDPGINGVLSTRDGSTQVVQKYQAPKARLMALIIDGILTQKLPWTLVALGVAIALVMELAGVSSLSFAVGVYLPLSSTVPIFFGGLVRWLVPLVSSLFSRSRKGAYDDTAEAGPGSLYASGLIAGGALAGIGIAFSSFKEEWVRAFDLSQSLSWIAQSNITPIVCFSALMVSLLWVGVQPLNANKRK